MIRTLLLDLGNVLIHVDEARKCERTGALLGLTADQTAALLTRDKLQWRYESGLLSTEEFLEGLLQAAQRDFHPAELLRAFCDIFTPVAGMEKVISTLKARGMRLVLVSNTNAGHFTHARRVFPALADFDTFVLSYEVRAMKPDAAYYRHAAEAAECRVDQALFVDDLAANIAGAQAAGFRTHQFSNVEGLIAALRLGGIDLEKS